MKELQYTKKNMDVVLHSMMVLVGVAFLLGLVLGSYVAVDDMEQRAIKHKAGYYHPETKEFMWKVQE